MEAPKGSSHLSNISRERDRRCDDDCNDDGELIMVVLPVVGDDDTKDTYLSASRVCIL